MQFPHTTYLQTFKTPGLFLISRLDVSTLPEGKAGFIGFSFIILFLTKAIAASNDHCVFSQAE